MGFSNELSCEAGSFSCCHLNPHRYFQSDVEASIPCPGTLVCMVCLAPETPWLSDFYAVRFSISSGCSLFLNLLLSSFWLHEEAQCLPSIQLGWKSHPRSYCLFLNTNPFSESLLLSLGLVPAREITRSKYMHAFKALNI